MLNLDLIEVGLEATVKAQNLRDDKEEDGNQDVCQEEYDGEEEEYEESVEDDDEVQ